VTDSEGVSKGTIVVLSGDLFFGMRIRTTLRGMGYAGVLTKEATTFTEKLTSEEAPACLGFIDFNKPIEWDSLRLAIDSGVPIVAFGAHTNVDGFRMARSAGVTRVISNGSFSSSLPDLIEKYARRQAEG